ncbi:hypothetical protein SteCoe_29047 [Stentor coeruleus]|uniref:Uncharacterized protein n=1 Tax=Stentor coeruleus TaxID=5963 RepID=A0A1R2B6R8_9CILI|nr:hypothetical protein SteCoe_29047 [Stentor coeruleus]
MGCIESKNFDQKRSSKSKKNSKNHQFEIYAAIMSSKIDKVDELISKCFDVSYKMPNFMGRTALHVAAEYGNIKIMVTLLENGADINALDFYNCPPIFLAMKKGYLKAVDFMIEAGANVNIVTKYNLSFHDFICNAKKKESLILLKNINYRKSRVSNLQFRY